MSDVLKATKIGLEDELRERLAEHAFYRKEVRPLFRRDGGEDAGVGYDLVLRKYLREAAEITPASHGSLFALLDSAEQRLGVVVTARVFKVNEPGGLENATILSHDDNVLISFHSGILDSLSDDDSLLSVIGHELGHFGHGHLSDHVYGDVVELDSRILESQSGFRLAKDDAKELRRLARSKGYEEVVRLCMLLSQAAELNADRAGLLSGSSFDGAVKGAMVLSAGPADRFGDYLAATYLEQARELVSREDLFDDGDWERTHPLEPLRVLALEYFAESDVFRDVTGKGPATRKMSGFDQLLPRLLPLDRLPSATTRNAASKLTRPVAEVPPKAGEPAESSVSELEYLAIKYACMTTVVAADGKLTPAERCFVESQLRPVELADEMLSKLDAMTDEQHDAEMTRLIELGRSLPARAKTTLIKLMIKTAKADRRVTDSEIATIRMVSADMDASAQAERQIANAWGKGR